MRIKHLDGLRCVAILLVVLFHCYARWANILPYQNITKDFFVFKYGFYGVELFFLISGFVIFMTLDKSENYLTFLKRRWLRLFPAMLITSLISYFASFFLTNRLGGQPHPLSLLPGWLFINSRFLEIITGKQITPIEGVYWSLYIEVFFYLFIGMVYFYIGRKHCIKALSILYFLSLIISLLHNHHPFDDIDKLSYILGLRYFNYFTIGCVIYESVNKRFSKEYILLLTVCIILSILILVRNTSDKTEWLVFISIISLFISSFYSSFIKKILSFKIITIIGMTSYSLYLIHETIVISLMGMITTLTNNITILIIAPVVLLLIMFGLSYFIEKNIEPSLRNALTYILFRNSKQKLSSDTESRLNMLQHEHRPGNGDK